MADIPAGTGLGSSGSFTVGVLKALHSHLRRPVTNEELAALACHVEIDRLGEPIGKQDQYAAAIGGLTAFQFNARRVGRRRASRDARRAEARRSRRTSCSSTPACGDRRRRRSPPRSMMPTGRGVDRRQPEGGPRARLSRAVERLGSRRPRPLRPAAHRAVAAKLRPFAAHLHAPDRRVAAARASPRGRRRQADRRRRRWIPAVLRRSQIEIRQHMAKLGLEEVRFSFDHEGSMTLVV